MINNVTFRPFFSIMTTGSLVLSSFVHAAQVTRAVDREIIAGSKQLDAVCPCAIRVVKLP